MLMNLMSPETGFSGSYFCRKLCMPICSVGYLAQWAAKFDRSREKCWNWHVTGVQVHWRSL